MIEAKKKISDALSEGFDSLNMDCWKTSIETLIDFALERAQDREIKDLTAFIDYNQAQGKAPGWISAELLNDLTGIAYPTPSHQPRCSGYADLV